MSTKIIAEIGINHNGDIGIIKKLIDIADAAGCDYVKFQKRNPDSSVPNNQKNKRKNTPWGEMTYLDYKKKIELGKAEYDKINDYCSYTKNIKWFASVWDLESAEFMKQYTNIVKIPSAHLTNTKLGKYCRENFDTLILSTGMSTEEEIGDAVLEYKPDVIMHTNSCYPTKIEELNLRYIEWLRDLYPSKKIGFSSHDYGIISSIMAIALGATWIENHITLSHDMWGSDQQSSKEPVGLFKLVKNIRDMEKALGKYGERKLFDSELEKKKSLRGQ